MKVYELLKSLTQSVDGDTTSLSGYERYQKNSSFNHNLSVAQLEEHADAHRRDSDSSPGLRGKQKILYLLGT